MSTATEDYLVVSGTLVLLGKSPDGDSVRFLADDQTLLPTVEHGDRLRSSGDGTVQLRFDAVDAPELHYAGVEQPLGADSRDALLAHLGFTDVGYAPGTTTVTSATPATLPAVVLCRMVEVNGRPVALVVSGEAAAALADASGQRRPLDTDLLAVTVNSWLLETGTAYPLLYTSTEAALRDALRSSAAAAREAGRGVWALDSTARFQVEEQADLGPAGALIFPKLFRRATDYLRNPAGQTLPEWLAATPEEDDSVVVAGADPVPLHSLLTQDGGTVTVGVDLLDLVFVEK